NGCKTRRGRFWWRARPTITYHSREFRTGRKMRSSQPGQGGPQSRQRGIGDGDDGSGPHSLAGRMAPIVKWSMRRCSTNVLRYQWASLSASRSDLGSRNFHTHKFLIALEWVEEPRWPEPYSG